jgi:hypothetical protein
MKTLIFSFSLLVLGLFVSLNSLFAQDQNDSMRIAFVTSERTEILGYTAGRAKSDVILTGNSKIKLSHMAVLAQTTIAGDQYLLLGGKLNFPNPVTSTPDSVQGMLKIKLPFTLGTVVSLDRKNIGGIQVLAELYELALKPLPLGTLNASGTDWYAVWCKMSAIPFTFYHGKFDGTGTIDSLQVTGQYASYSVLGGFHMTNLCYDQATNTLFCGVMDKLNSGTDHQERLQLFRWLLSGNTFQAPQLTSQLIPRWPDPHNIDSSFGCVMRIVPGPGNPTAEMLLNFDNPGNYEMYNFRWDIGNPSLSENSNRTLPRAAIPDSIAFFCGWNGNTNGPGDDKETTSDMQRYNNGGDLGFTPSGDTMIFIVHDNVEGTITPQKSGIWMYDMVSGNSKFLFNDFTKIERQPIFLGYTKFIPPAEGRVIFDKQLVEITDSVEIGKTKDFTFKMSNPTKDPVVVTLLEKTGVNELDFSQPVGTPPFTTPQQLVGEASVDFTVTFTPSAVGLRTATITAHWGSHDSTTSVVLKGYGKQSAGVADDPEHAFSVSVNPNPFNAKTHITITGKENNRYDVSFRDVLGRNIEAALPSYQYGQGGMLNLDIDAKMLGLVPGAYYLNVRAGGNMISRQIIYIK